MALLAVAGHLLLLPIYLAARHWDLAQHPLGQGHWPGEAGWPAGSGSSDWQVGQLPVLVSWLLLLIVLFSGCAVLGLATVFHSAGRFFIGKPTPSLPDDNPMEG